MSQELPLVESKDINAFWTSIVGWGFAAFLVGLAALLWLIYAGAIHEWLARSPNYSINSFPTPRLSSDPDSPLAAVRAQEENEITSYKWSDDSHGHAQVPIERALQIAASRGLIQVPAGSQLPRKQKGAAHAR